MVENSKVAEALATKDVAVAKALEPELIKAVQEYAIAGDTKAMMASARELADLQKHIQVLESTGKAQQLNELATEIEAVISEKVQWYIQQGKLDLAKGVYYSFDFEQPVVKGVNAVVRFSKGAGKVKVAGKSTGGGAPGKKIDKNGNPLPKTDELVATFGETVITYRGKEATIKELYDSNTDGNYRFGLREKLEKLHNDSLT